MLSSSKCLSWLNALQQQPQATTAPRAPCPVAQTPTQGNSTKNSGLKCRHLRQSLIPSVQFPAYVFYFSAALLHLDECGLGTRCLPTRNPKHSVACQHWGSYCCAGAALGSGLWCDILSQQLPVFWSSHSLEPSEFAIFIWGWAEATSICVSSKRPGWIICTMRFP